MSIKIHTIENLVIKEYEKSNIFIIENILPDNTCDKIRDLIEKIPTIHKTFTLGNNVQCYAALMNELLLMDDSLYYKFSTENDSRKLKDILKHKDIYTSDLNCVPLKELSDLSNTMDQTISIIAKILLTFQIKIDATTGYILRKIYGETRLHRDGLSDSVARTNLHYLKDNKIRDKSFIRTASILFTLNDDYDGGEFVFPVQDISIKLKKGSVLIFPPYWTHEHGTNKLFNNTFRYTITTWGCESVYTFGL